MAAVLGSLLPHRQKISLIYRSAKANNGAGIINWVDSASTHQILGPVIVKDCARIGSNAVVTKDVPKGGIMVGIPAKNIKTGGKKPDTSFAPYAVTKK